MKRDYVSGGNGVKTNLYINPEIKALGKKLAKVKKISLSNLFELLVVADSKRRRGVTAKEVA